VNHSSTRCCAKGFTLVELIVVIVIMTILAGFSAMAYRGIAADLRISSALNTVTAALDNARAMAIKKNRYVITVFRPRLVNGDTQQEIDIVIAQWNNDSANADRGGGDIWTYDRFTPLPGLKVRTIKGGVNVAGPGYGTGDDDTWWVSTYLPANAAVPNSEACGAIVGVLYNPEGRVVVRNAESGSDRIWVDFDLDGDQTISDIEVVDWPWPNPLPSWLGDYFNLEIPEGEPFISMTTILAVFNEEECRSAYDVTRWTPDSDCESDLRDNEYTEYINTNSDRIQFNRYSGVPMK